MTTTMMSRRKKMHKGVEISQEVGTILVVEVVSSKGPGTR